MRNPFYNICSMNNHTTIGSVGILKILSDGVTGQRGRGPEAAIGLGIRVVVVDAEQEGIEGDPGKAQGQNFKNGASPRTPGIFLPH